MADGNPSLCQQILYISMAEIEPIVEPNGILNNSRQGTMSFVDVFHPKMLPEGYLTCQYRGAYLSVAALMSAMRLASRRRARTCRVHLRRSAVAFSAVVLVATAGTEDENQHQHQAISTYEHISSVESRCLWRINAQEATSR